ncbi:MAG: 1-acyl-sn-glycerol-3-phosphate acyltransferase [Parachlamydiaceae bacterium]|nr:1-acyl-sn-glycerol-3-phosphate acyltransferase [Parachlamydiaceae bacterium]
MDPLKNIDHLIAAGQFPLQIGEGLKKFFESYKEALESNDKEFSDFYPLLNTFTDLVMDQLQTPFAFEPYHQRITSPFDYYRFGLELMRPLILFDRSKVINLENVEKIAQQVKNKENVILFANHQTEPDPQIINLLLESKFPDLVKEIIFVAGHRVISDPLAIPFSRGCNLLCIFSKKYLESPPEEKTQKQLHNQKTLQRMKSLLEEGGKCIYVAPSGGRDRMNSEGVVEVAPFDFQSIELFYLISQQVKPATHFYPLALSTYHLLPPPASIAKTLGERRYAQCTPVSLSFGNEIEMRDFPGNIPTDKRKNRELRTDHIFKLVKDDYQRLID